MLRSLVAHTRMSVAGVVVSLALTTGGAFGTTVAPVRECGGAGSLHGGSVAIHNVTTRNVDCAYARRWARQYLTNPSPQCAEDLHCEWRGWQILNDGRYSRSEVDVRATKGNRVIRFQWSAS
jgi:hypothetical protein